jgi:nitroreductase
VADQWVSGSAADAIAGRRSVRGFLKQDVPLDLVRQILEIAARAPSMNNTQPWRTHLLVGAARDRLCDEVCAAFDAGELGEMEYEYRPHEWVSPYIDRRRQIGWALYGMVGIAKGDRAATHRQHKRNFTFFDAPVGMIFTIERVLATGSYLDYGMFLQNIMTAARGYGLDSCAQAAWGHYPGIIRRQLGIPEHEIIVCGMALGYADPAEPANALVPPRETLESFLTLHE